MRQRQRCDPPHRHDDGDERQTLQGKIRAPLAARCARVDLLFEDGGHVIYFGAAVK